MPKDQFPVAAGRPSQASIEEGLRRAMRPAPGRAAVRVAPGPEPGLQRIIFAVLRDVAQVKGGTILELASGDWLLTEAPMPEAEGLSKLIGKLVPAGDIDLLPLPKSKAVLAGYLEAAPALLELPMQEGPSPFGLETRLAQLNPGAMFLRRSYVSFNRVGSPILSLQRLALDDATLRKVLDPYSRDEALLRHAKTTLDNDLLEALGQDGRRNALMGGAPAAPLLIDMPPALLPVPSAAEGEPRDPAATMALYATLALHEAISLEDLSTRREALQRDAWGIAISGLSADALSLVNVQALPADWIILEWSTELEEKTSLKLLGQLDPTRIILDGCKSQSAVVFGLGLGIACFGGPMIEDLVAAARMDSCPKAMLCTRAECRARGLATSPSGRIGCHLPHLLEAVLPGAAA
jgi:hypothetical protein